MKKIFRSIIIVLMLAVFAIPAFAVNYDYYAAVYKRDATKRGGEDLTLISTGITFKVLTADSDTAATLTAYADKAGTSVTNPVTAANFASTSVCGGLVKFRTTASTVDLIVVDTSGGYTAVVKGFSPNDHSIIIDETIGVQHSGMIWFESGHASNTETDTGVDFVADTFIQDVRVEVVTVVSGKIIDVGLLSTETSGDADGLRDGVLLTTAGFVADTGVITGGNTIDYTPVTTYGKLLVTAITGSDAVATNGGKSYIGHVVTGTNAKSLCYTSDTSTGDGYFHYTFTRLR
ncbi:MAG: hypothetical protein PHS93_10145 [Candidatus Omnitrophica bacterium]|nr:hypothetical protein [Candidatus Omnitrophota bacterium]MDD5540750.1 hypothetical protein [Candidatus Neomarinimicrobiota bacterium]